MFYNAKEKLLEIQDIQMNYITFGKGEKSLILIQGLSTRSIKGVTFSVAYMVLRLRCMPDLAVLRLPCCGKAFPKHFT